jgi:hypothetical protein
LVTFTLVVTVAPHETTVAFAADASNANDKTATSAPREKYLSNLETNRFASLADGELISNPL